MQSALIRACAHKSAFYKRSKSALLPIATDARTRRIFRSAPQAEVSFIHHPCFDWLPLAQRLNPVGDGPPDLVRRIFLNEMDPRHRLLGQRWPPADEVDKRIIGED